MSNFTIKIDLLKFKGASLQDIQGQPGKKAIVIPVDNPGFFVGTKGVYLDLNAVAMQRPQYQDTHCIKPHVGKDQYQAMSEQERTQIPIVGGMHELIYQQQGGYQQSQGYYYPQQQRPQPQPAYQQPYPGQYAPQPAPAYPQGYQPQQPAPAQYPQGPQQPAPAQQNDGLPF